MYIEYLDLPHIPDELIEGYDVILNHPVFVNQRNQESNTSFYSTRRLQEKLYWWLRRKDIAWPWQINKVNTQYQILSSDVPVHRDIGRTVAYNYILYPGGDNVVTNIYNVYKQVIESVCIEPFRWHRINVSKLHGVHNIVPGLNRISITVNPPFIS
jgi:hypothetical protein